MIKITLNEHKLYNVGLGIIMAINYMIEGFFMYLLYFVVNHWITTGNEMFFWILGGLFLLFIRMVVSICGLGDNSDESWRTRVFNFHWLQVWRTGVTIRSFLSGRVSVEIK